MHPQVPTTIPFDTGLTHQQRHALLTALHEARRERLARVADLSADAVAGDPVAQAQRWVAEEALAEIARALDRLAGDVAGPGARSVGGVPPPRSASAFVPHPAAHTEEGEDA